MADRTPHRVHSNGDASRTRCAPMICSGASEFTHTHAHISATTTAAASTSYLGPGEIVRAIHVHLPSFLCWLGVFGRERAKGVVVATCTCEHVSYVLICKCTAAAAAHPGCFIVGARARGWAPPRRKVIIQILPLACGTASVAWCMAVEGVAFTHARAQVRARSSESHLVCSDENLSSLRRLGVWSVVDSFGEKDCTGQQWKLLFAQHSITLIVFYANRVVIIGKSNFNVIFI